MGMALFQDAAALARRFGMVGAIPARTIELSGQSLAAIEAMALRLLWARLDATIEQPRALGGSTSRPVIDDPATLMSSLLSRGLAQNTATSTRELHAAVLRQLVPDEARILAALADGPPSPLVTVFRRGGNELLLANASLIGRTAAVTLPSRTAKYVSHLLALGLVETGPEDETDQRGYELVLAEKEVRAALKEGEFSKLPARVQRRTLRLSAHGRELWAATQPGGDR